MQSVDIAIAGSGIACTATLIEVFKKLLGDAPGKNKISITVIEKNQEFWLGVPYGSRSSVNALTITTIADFFTDEKQRAGFFEWFKANKTELIAYYLEKGGLTAHQWLESNHQAVETEDWKNVYLPRFMFGRHYQANFKDLLKTVTDRQLAEVNLIHAEAIDAKPVKDGLYELTLEHPDKKTSTLTTAKLVIATGSAPVREFNHSLTESSGITYINDLYDPGADINLKKLGAALNAANKEDRNVLIIGSNASSIELLYLLAGLPDVTGLINRLVVVSRSGLLPYHISGQRYDQYPCENLDKLKAAGNYTIKTLVAAAMEDIKPAVKDGVIVPYIDRIIGYTIELMQVLDEDAKKQFLGIYGMQLSNLFRRSGTDYKRGAAILHEMQKLIMLKGAFVNIEASPKGGILTYAAADTNKEQKYDAPFAVVINCTGANDLDKSSGRLIYNLVHNNICEVNLSDKGFYVNEHFEAAHNLYVMGPLLGGNMNKRIHFWHLENASRIMYLAPFLAECLVG